MVHDNQATSITRLHSTITSHFPTSHDDTQQILLEAVSGCSWCPPMLRAHVQIPQLQQQLTSVYWQQVSLVQRQELVARHSHTINIKLIKSLITSSCDLSKKVESMDTINVQLMCHVLGQWAPGKEQMPIFMISHQLWPQFQVWELYALTFLFFKLI